MFTHLSLTHLSASPPSFVYILSLLPQHLTFPSLTPSFASLRGLSANPLFHVLSSPPLALSPSYISLCWHPSHKTSLRALKVEGPSGYSFSNFSMNMNVVEQDVVKEHVLLWQVSAGTWESVLRRSHVILMLRVPGSWHSEDQGFPGALCQVLHWTEKETKP